MWAKRCSIIFWRPSYYFKIRVQENTIYPKGEVTSSMGSSTAFEMANFYAILVLFPFIWYSETIVTVIENYKPSFNFKMDCCFQRSWYSLQSLNFLFRKYSNKGLILQTCQCVHEFWSQVRPLRPNMLKKKKKNMRNPHNPKVSNN